MSGGLMLEEIIINLFLDTTKQKIDSAQNILFSEMKDDKIYFYQQSLQDYSWKKIISDIINKLHTHHFIEKGKLRKYIGGLLSIIIDERDIETRTNKLVNDIINFNNEHKINCYSVTQSNIPEEPRYISSMPPTGFINGQDKSMCYVNS